MGLHNIWKHLKLNKGKSTKSRFPENTKELVDFFPENTKAWVDILAYVFPYMGSPMAMKETMTNLNNILQQANLSPVYVLDECRISSAKRETFLRRKNHFLQKDRLILIWIMENLGLSFVVAPFEAEAVVVLHAWGELDKRDAVIISEDSDVMVYLSLAFGSRLGKALDHRLTWIRHFLFHQDRQMIDCSSVEVLSEFCPLFRMDHEVVPVVASIIGSDYCVGINGIGWETIWGAQDETRSVDNLMDYVYSRARPRFP
jgi:hypothetical protein